MENNEKPKKINLSAIIIILLLIVIAGMLFYYIRIVKKANVVVQQTPEEPKFSVVASPIATKTFERYAAVQGNLEAKNFAYVSPRIPGTIEELFVDEGDNVTAGKTMLFRIDSVKLEQAVEAGRKALAIAESTEKQAQAGLEKIKVDFEKVQLDYNRYKRLYEKKAVTANAFELQESHYNQLKAAIKAAQADIDLARSNIERARADLIISQKNLSDTVVYAPISGFVSARFKEPGEMGSPEEPALLITDNNSIEVSAYLPAQYYSEVIAGQTKMRVNVFGKEHGEQSLYYKSPTIENKLRTFEVKCLLDNSSHTIAAGAMADIKVIFETRKALAVPTVSIQKRVDGNIIFTVKDGRAHQVAVQTGLENDGMTEVSGDELSEKDMVITMGQNMLDDGKVVAVQEGNK
ncbi:MAG: efflux RND transporter periplasmic adaptor subunit [Planctomycetaceae bacterium]|nr:efflux RND transporter periplasmic adaptor subunit [Planctomycetaceae bacterium]